MSFEPTATTGFVAAQVAPLVDPVSREVQISLLERLTAPKYRPPVLPVIAVQLMELARKPSVTVREIAGLIEQDPVLAADMLKLTHSALMALNAPIRTVEEALVRLGIRRSTELFTQAALKAKLFRCRGYENVLERLRRHSVATAEVTRLLCDAAGVGDDLAYLTGLLHDVGIAGCILALEAKGRYLPPPPFERAWPAISDLQQRFALHLVTKWQLPKEIRHSLAQHFAFMPKAGPAPLAAASVLAEILTGSLGMDFENECSQAHRSAAQSCLGLSNARVEQVLADAAGLLARFD